MRDIIGETTRVKPENSNLRNIYNIILFYEISLKHIGITIKNKQNNDLVL